MKYLLLLVLLSLPGMAQESTTDNKGSTAISAVETGDRETDGPAPTDQDFKPEQEISEDYPIPLPSDI